MNPPLWFAEWIILQRVHLSPQELDELPADTVQRWLDMISAESQAQSSKSRGGSGR